MIYCGIHSNQFRFTRKIVKVIGGGKIAERRVNALINSEALIHVISPELTDKLKQYEIEGKLKWHKRTLKYLI